LVLGNINAAKYRQKIFEPFFEELHADELCRKDTFNRMEKLEEKLKKLITPRTC
jgi:alkylhydroperoxidase/carboxymuconolactone decarboxylase family protein YurZ